MRADGLPRFEMTFPHGVIEQKFRNREEIISNHLVKVLAFQTASTNFWKKEIRNHLIYLASMKLPSKQSANRLDIYNWLYGDPFTGNEIAYVEALIMMNADEHQRNDQSVEAIANTIKTFFATIAESLAQGDARPAITLLNSL